MNGRNTILLAEDQENDASLLRRAFEDSGLPSVIVVGDGQEVIEYLTASGRYTERDKYPLPNLLLLDLKMPRRSGLEVLEWVRSQHCLLRLPVVVLTASPDAGDVNRAYDLGVNSYLQKPPTFEELLSMVRMLADYWLVLSKPPSLLPEAPTERILCPNL